MVKPERRKAALLAGSLALLASVLVWQNFRQPASVSPARVRTADRGDDAAGDVPRIDLGRLDKKPPAVAVGRKDIFQYGPSLAEMEHPVATPPPRVVVATPPPTLPPPPPTPSVPLLNVKYVGTVESSKQGVKVAVLITDRQEVLTGQVGDLVANRFRIVKIGYESVDIQDVGSDRVRRIPYKGN